MKIVASASVLVLSAVPACVAAQDSSSSPNNRAAPIASIEQAAKAMAAPLAFRIVPVAAEVLTRIAGQAGEIVRAAAQTIDPNVLPIPPLAGPARKKPSAQRDSLAPQALASLAEAAARAAQRGLGTAIPPTDVPCPAEGSFTLAATPGPEFTVEVQYHGCKTAQP